METNLTEIELIETKSDLKKFLVNLLKDFGRNIIILNNLMKMQGLIMKIGKKGA